MIFPICKPGEQPNKRLINKIMCIIVLLVATSDISKELGVASRWQANIANTPYNAKSEGDKCRFK
ncbi:hypothetical protein CQP30_06050 [Yersinia pestis]|uniref:Uncharacterized protein n=1 Tax=Yersinia pseudotuberculosis TaxID=633 RepID=A0ABM7AF87_YERPU|nr:hypothetical protein A1122_03300 [Yersinia pestis A1122]ANW15904.1 hypothetical protein BAY22_19125 [Yersinia pestis]AXY34632.1 hypothetical protein CEQ20_15350 [Yersinia pseudotuberculosis]ERP78853.1 hypothetical protein L327_01790 [Yersinia pestis S3]ERP79492.1 hypothetical protein L328_01795 [Yersinia pestis 24H]ERP80756.1 hypothetical protein L326_01790 [Yersinia pestis 113]ERP84699.1 hypothetical protein L325_01770 [Yersinia pestis 9]KFB60860.1 hypothetical protein EX92_12210 [Yersin